MTKLIESLYPTTVEEVNLWLTLWTWWYYGLQYIVTCVGAFT